MKRKIRIVFWDYDGVLSRSEFAMYESVADVFRILRPNGPVPSFAEVWQTISAPYEAWYRARGFTEPYEQLIEAHNRNGHIEHAKLNSEALAILPTLQAAQIPMHIVSASPSARLLRMLARERAEHFFEGIFGDAEHTKVGYMQRVLRNRGLLPREALIVGDRPSDIRDGRAAGVITVAYTGGHQTAELLGNATPDHLITHLNDLLKLFFPDLAAPTE